MSQLFKIIKPYPGFEVGAIITVASPTRFADMNRGFGEPYTPPVEEKKTVKKTGGRKRK